MTISERILEVIRNPPYSLRVATSGISTAKRTRYILVDREGVQVAGTGVMDLHKGRQAVRKFNDEYYLARLLPTFGALYQHHNERTDKQAHYKDTPTAELTAKAMKALWDE